MNQTVESLKAEILAAFQRHPRFNHYVETREVPFSWGPRPRLICNHCTKNGDYVFRPDFPGYALDPAPVVDTSIPEAHFRYHEMDAELLPGQCQRCGLKVNVVRFWWRRVW